MKTTTTTTTTQTIRTAAQLKREVERHGNCPHFFERDTMRFFGDTMANYGVRRVTGTPHSTALAGYYGLSPDEDTVEAYELYRRRPVRHGLQDSAYFHPVTFARLHSFTPTTR